MKSEVKDVSPEMAEAMLRTNMNNRPLVRTRINELVRIIKTGQWKLTHQGVAVSPDGELVDGQHRLAAIARSGETVPLLVSTVDDSIFDVIDTGRARGPRDALAMANHKHYVRLPPAIRLVAHYRGPNADALMGGTTRLTNTEFLAIAAAEPAYERHAPHAERIAASVGRRGYVTPFLASLVIIEQDAPELTDTRTEFFSKLEHPTLLTEASPVFALRRWLTVTVPAANYRSKQAQAVLFGTIRAWNAYVEGRPMERIPGHRERGRAPVVATRPPTS